MKKILMAAVACICITAMSTTFSSCKEMEEEVEGMNDANAYYSYGASSEGTNGAEAEGQFRVAIQQAVGRESILGGADDKVIQACDKCYDNIKPKFQGKSATVFIIKKRHPDGRQKNLKVYIF
jgi:hypothetical protein